MRKLFSSLAVALTLALMAGAAYAAVTGSLTTTASQKKGPKKAVKAKKGKSVQLKFTGSVTGELDASTSGSLGTITSLSIGNKDGITFYPKDVETCTATVLQTDGVAGCDDASILSKIDLTVTLGSSISGNGTLYFVYSGGKSVIMFADIATLNYNGTSLGPLKLAFANTTINSSKTGFSLDIDLSALLSSVGSASSALSGAVNVQLSGTVGSKSDSPLRVVQCTKSKQWKITLKAGAIETFESVPCKQTKK